MRVYNTALWSPYSPEIVADWLDWTVDMVRAQFGDTVLVRIGLSSIELQPGPPSEAEMRARVSRILAGAGSRTETN